MKVIRNVARLGQINWILLKHALRLQTSPGIRMREACEDLGPIFIKFGQLLSTRADLLPDEVAAELAKLQDQVPAFCGKQARSMIESALGKPINE
ncbi:MAG TPA: ubiquinone biosynthesis regulatory protein kinase UbiB, partial [Gammaproteobacteria bacterium]|nr:ubiquinone biosynthesis regulatory protein kinase UbiB [Gammaproteobacteria bacterium]